MKSSFNAYGKAKREYSTLHIPVWLGTVTRVPVGGVLASDFVKPGLFIPAGTPINIDAKVITPFIAFPVVSFTADASGDDTIVIKPVVMGDVEFLPAVGDKIMKLGATFAATGKAAAVKSVTALTGADAGKYSVAVVHSATVDTPSAGDAIVFSSATAAGSGKSVANQPNAYLYHDIWLGDLNTSDSDTFATGAAVMYHPEGLLIDRTPGAALAAALKVAIPGVLLVND